VDRLEPNVFISIVQLEPSVPLGRCFTEEGTEKYGGFLGSASTLSCQIADDYDVLEDLLTLDIILKEEYKGHSQNFWADIQCLHDNPENWNNEGITEEGQDRVNYLLEKWAKC
jgi:hypothetical protein